MIDPKHIAALLTAAGLAAGAMYGTIKVTTPEAQECAVSLADKSARLELTTGAMESCSKALDLCAGGK